MSAEAKAMPAFSSKLESLWSDARSTQAYLLYVAILACILSGTWEENRLTVMYFVSLARWCCGLNP
jgi:hypothetical protein